MCLIERERGRKAEQKGRTTGDVCVWRAKRTWQCLCFALNLCLCNLFPSDFC